MIDLAHGLAPRVLHLIRAWSRCRGWSTVALVFALAIGGPIAAQTTERVSVGSEGQQANDDSYGGSISGDGRYVAFSSLATNLVSGGTNDEQHIYVHDRVTGQTTRVSVSSSGEQGNDNSHRPAISADGRFVAFLSLANNLVEGDFGIGSDIFVHDRQTAVTTMVSVSSQGEPGNLSSNWDAVITPHGRYVAFASAAHNLIPDDTNFKWDVFVHDRLTAQTIRISVSSMGEQANDHSFEPSISTDGRFVAFHSNATNLAGGDSNQAEDIYFHDRDPDENGLFDEGNGVTTRVSDSSTGQQGNGDSHYPAVSGDGRLVVFHSLAGNLVEGDTNGVGDVFVHDRQTGQTTRASISSDGQQANATCSWEPTIFAAGRYVAFGSFADNLVPGDTNNHYDVFVRDRLEGRTTRVSVSATGEQGNDSSSFPSGSGSGRYVAFFSEAGNLVAGDTNGEHDIFVRDLGLSAPGDFDGDGDVDIADFSVLLACVTGPDGEDIPSACVGFDFDGDDDVDFADFGGFQLVFSGSR